MSAIARRMLACRAVGAVIVLAVCSVLVACGADADEPSLTAAQAAELQRSISAARGGAEQDDRAAVHAALERFRSDVRRLAANGALSPDHAEVLLSGAEQAKRRVEADIAPVVESPGDVPADGRGEQRAEEDEDDKDDKKEKEEKEKEDDEEGEDDD